MCVDCAINEKYNLKISNDPNYLFAMCSIFPREHKPSVMYTETSSSQVDAYLNRKHRKHKH